MIDGEARPTMICSTGRLADPAGGSPAPLRQALHECAEYPHVRVVRDFAVLRRIGHLRHEQYVQGQGKPYRSDILERDCLVEIADFSAVNIYAADASGLTAAMRIGLLEDRHQPQGTSLREAAAAAGIDPALTLVCSRLVRPATQRGRHVADLVRFVRLRTVTGGYRYCVMQTAERLVPFFRRFEFQETGCWSDDGPGGRLQVMILDTRMQPVLGRTIHHDAA
ncbi:hypothetical protein FF100_05525 [Methylobacterium terricola]|uniref:N-acetyltransferase domain-containing protein n=1 Tax=Methylobacterium terricola TaxID=2583531 RepID=A0A5C4LKJ9_9HYPH|nr:hypothetical protein [Methylobacterium terricola]TNC15027.1 hypothetical protein FF100_05525 [Methylobacterium terricola]